MKEEEEEEVQKLAQLAKGGRIGGRERVFFPFGETEVRALILNSGQCDNGGRDFFCMEYYYRAAAHLLPKYGKQKWLRIVVPMMF